ncbi:MAG: glycosyltransferase [Bacteroidota bacterium]
MNIAIFTPNQNPYSETFIQAHKHYLKDKVFYYYGVGDHIRLEEHPPLISTFKRLRLKAVQLIFNKPKHYIWSKAVLNALKKHNTDVILVEYGTHAHRLMPVLDEARLPFAVHYHGYDASVDEVIKSHDNYSQVFAQASRVFAVSTVMKNRLLKEGCLEEKLIYNVYGPQPKFAEVKPEYSNQQFIAIGRFTDKKAPYYTLFAFQKVLDSYPKARLIMAGQGTLLNACRNISTHLGIDDNVDFVGVVTPEEYAQYLSESLAFVQHSITADNGDMEGTPLAVLEASSAGLPVISTYHAGISDVIVHRETGLLCKEHDVDLMSKHMIQLLDNKDDAKRMGQAGKAHIKANFSLERHISVLQDHLMQICK